jgi:hypothetical protein
MEYRGKYKVFDTREINTNPLRERTNKVKLKDLILIETALSSEYEIDKQTKENIEKIALEIVRANKGKQPVIIFGGAHLVKNGLGPLIVDLINRGVINLFAGNAATVIHDFELALIGETSEYVPAALEKGQFGMAYEFAYINTALKYGNLMKLGYGESLGKMICEEDFRNKIFAEVAHPDSPKEFQYPRISILEACYRNDIPCTIHAGIGTDVIDQHQSFDGEAKGGCSGRDFLIYTNEIAKLKNGGVVLNIGSAVTGPEVLLKAISMAANTGSVPKAIITGDFDLRNYRSELMTDEASENYYYRDHKSIVTRVPQAFGGTGFYIQGNQLNTLPYLYKMIIKHLQTKLV